MYLISINHSKVKVSYLKFLKTGRIIEGLTKVGVFGLDSKKGKIY